jgi:tocopherol O-methyltransferase
MITPAGCIPDNAAIAAHYDDLDELYREIWGTDVHHGYWITGKESAMEAVANLTRLVAEKAAIRSGDRVCDMGCGYGGGARMLNRDYGAEVTGFTISPKQFDHAKAAANGNEQLNFILVDALHNNLPAKSFDAVIAIESTEHVALKPRLISEARRLLRCGGHFVIAAWLANERATGWRKKYLLEPICAEGLLPNMGSADEYLEMLSQCGFRNIKLTDLTVKVKKTWTICALRLIRRIVADPALRRRLRDPRFTNRIFAKTIFRIRFAYETGAMRYGIFSAVK